MYITLYHSNDLQHNILSAIYFQRIFSDESETDLSKKWQRSYLVSKKFFKI